MTTFKAIAAFWGALAIGLWQLGVLFHRFRLMQRAAAWPSAPGTVCLAWVEVQGSWGHRRSDARVVYAFEQAGTQVTGHTPRLSGDWFWTTAAQQAFVDRYEAGQPVRVYYDPADARRNCLDRTDRSGLAVLAVVAAAMLSLAAALVALDPGVAALAFPA